MNFEALGRYTDAVERASRLARSRDGSLAEIARQLNVFTGSKSGGHIAVAVDFGRIAKQLDEAEKIDAELVQAVAEANAVAQDCDKRPLKLWQQAVR
ncbi:MAG: hypothetical protein LBR95_08925 [Azoarcus sp.]|nr:hypothetical protein [Azoarcus sp.]